MGEKGSSQVSRREIANTPDSVIGSGYSESVDDVGMSIHCSMMHGGISIIVKDVQLCTTRYQTGDEPR